ncbi:GATA zinc finger domain-containing protein 1 [Trichogramma pretiosum]|uniref:GATA zinc finger domain-containing protein 1 n=1 Tax=Trichogramma kaykai TaxID=54128 RepID=A0ABD2X132_9HYME|nr:GATA zinc finger domain-containing protein 1 [Trichogramma pretiosum]
MPLGVKPECSKCGVKESPLWHATEKGSVCNDCLEPRHHPQRSEDAGTDEISHKPGRKSTRVTRFGCKPTLKTTGKGKGRRHIFKKMPMKSLTATATPVTSDFVFFKGSYFQVGDIVSMQDVDGGIYYAQIRGLLTDQYCEKSAAITWLLPTTSSPPPEEGFKPETYIIGPEEDLPRKLEYMEFVMHAPSDYYKLKNSPYPPLLFEGGNGYIWTSLNTEARFNR